MRRFRLAALGILVLVLCFGSFAWAASDHAITNVSAQHAMVAAANKLAAQAGLEILEKGGNAVDAAVATGFALNVVESNASGIGGGGFMLIRPASTGKVVAIDYREAAPAAFTKDIYASEEAKKNQISAYGPLAVGVPGTLAGYALALEQYGTLSLAEVLAPAIKLAEEGFPLAPTTAEATQDHLDTLSKYNTPENNPFVDADGLPLEPGTLVKQPKLAEAFRLIARHGIRAFYNGPIGESMVDTIQKLGGNMTMNDLHRYHAVLRTPAEGTYRGYKIYSMCPPSSGGITVVEIMNILENFPLGEWKHNSHQSVHHMAAAFQLAFSDRANYMADPSFYNIPFDTLQSKEYGAQLAAKIPADKALTEILNSDIGVDEQWSTTHFSVADEAGNIVACTQTVNYFFGSSIIDPKYGFVYNDEMDDFSSNPESVNAPEPGKRPLSSMSPTIVLDPEGKPFLAVGSPGAWRIITSVAEIISNVVDFKMNMDEAIEAPRFTSRVLGTKPDVLQAESRISQEVLDTLAVMGYEIKVRGDYDLYFGGAQGILFTDEGLQGAADSRRDGDAVGY